MIERVTDGQAVLAIIIRNGYRRDGIEFFTPPEYSQQLAYMRRPRGHVIRPHVHNDVKREVLRTNEVLFVREGRVRVDFYSDSQRYVSSTTLAAGDVILLVGGGHGFEMLEESEMVEVKQGPFVGDDDKTHFDP